MRVRRRPPPKHVKKRRARRKQRQDHAARKQVDSYTEIIDGQEIEVRVLNDDAEFEWNRPLRNTPKRKRPQ